MVRGDGDRLLLAHLLACHFTPSYSARDVAAALDLARAEAERIHGALAKNPFLVTDNGSSFIARHFQRHIQDRFAHVRIQYRTPTQLGLLERFHQTLKTEEVYWRLYASAAEARESLEVFRRRYNEVRPHWALVPADGGDVLTPAEVYLHGQAIQLPKWQGWARAAREACAIGAGCAPAAGHGCLSGEPIMNSQRPKPVDLVDSSLREPGRLPWTTPQTARGVAHRAPLCPQAPQARSQCRDRKPRHGRPMPVSTLTKLGRTCPLDFGAKTWRARFASGSRGFVEDRPRAWAQTHA